jgi:hypothetical protein|tara:strand:+ start:417 stop:626 length:210 start_codon:yes stop_codon:yes gene_type:complete
MPVKFKPSHKSFVKGQGVKIEHSYIKTIAQDELIEYLNNSNSKPKIKQKVRNELTRRGVKLVWKTPSED